jgi:hypothetical protein
MEKLKFQRVPFDSSWLPGDYGMSANVAQAIELLATGLVEFDAENRGHLSTLVSEFQRQSNEIARLNQGIERMAALLVNKGIADPELIDALGVS